MIDREFKNLIVRSSNRGNVGFVNLDNIADSVVALALFDEIRRFSVTTTAHVELDLRNVQSISPVFISELMMLRKELCQSNKQLTLCLSQTIRELFQTLKLDRIFELISPDDPHAPFYGDVPRH